MTAPGSVTLGPDLVCVAAGASDDAATVLAAPAYAQRRVALFRSIFAAVGSPSTPPKALIRPLGHGVVAVALRCVRDPAHSCLVDEWVVPASGGTRTQTALGVPLPEYLSQRCGAAVVCTAKATRLTCAPHAVVSSCAWRMTWTPCQRRNQQRRRARIRCS